MLGVLTLALLGASGLWLQAQTVDGFTLINADSDQPIAGFDPLTNNALINLATLPTRNLNIRANTTPSTDFGSVTFALTGATARNQTEGTPPWALAGDSSGNYNAMQFNVGAHMLTATAQPGSSLTINFTVMDGASQSPTASITNPVDGASFLAGANILIKATTSDPDGTVTNVAFYAGATKLADDATAPYSFDWSNVPAGSCALKAVATDNSGVSGTSLPVNISVTNSVSVVLTSPANGASLPALAEFVLQATASDSLGTVTNVAFYAGLTRLADDATAPYSFTWSNVPVGGYSLRAVAANNLGVSSTSSVVFVTVFDPNALSHVEKWHPVDLVFTSSIPYANPFTNVSLSATFSGPGGRVLTVPGFYSGGQGWTVRFSPIAEGDWSYATASSDPNLNNQTGVLTCVPNTNLMVHGSLKVDPNHPRQFIYEDGTPCFLLSFEGDWLGEMDFGDPGVSKARSLVDIYRTNGFNGVLMQLYAYDTSWKSGTTSSYDFGPPTQIVWLGSNASPDYSRMNTNYFNSYDRVINYLFQNGVTAHIMLRVYNKQVNWPAKRSAGDNLYWAYVVARYQAYPNIIWDFSKESYNESDDAYERDTMVNIRSMDAYDRLLTIHDDDSFYNNPSYASTLDFRTDQGGLYSTMISERNASTWPIFQAETDYYQVGNDGGWTYNVHNDFLTVLTTTLECFMAGATVNYYYTYHSWDVMKYDEIPNGLSAYKNLADLFRSTAWRQLEPNEGLINSPGTGRHCLANPGVEYVVYLSGGGSVNLTIGGAASGDSLAAAWLNVVTGARSVLPNTGNGVRSFTNPWSDPALLRVSPTQPILTLSSSNGTPQLLWNAPGFVMEHAPQITGPWTAPSPQPVSPYLLSATNAQVYFRLGWPGP